jgi:hypothetical protein
MPSIQSTVEGLGSSGYVSSLSLQSTILGIGLGNNGYVSSLSLQSTILGIGLGNNGYISSLSLQSTVAGLGSLGNNAYVSSLSLQSTVLSFQTTVSTQRFMGSSMCINMPFNTSGFVLDVNGPSQSAVLYSNVAANTTITPAYYGTFYNITAGTTYTIALAATPGASNIGKYNVFRNNTGAALSFTITGGSGITSPVACADKQSITTMVATSNAYALF